MRAEAVERFLQQTDELPVDLASLGLRLPEAQRGARKIPGHPEPPAELRGLQAGLLGARVIPCSSLGLAQPQQELAAGRLVRAGERQRVQSALVLGGGLLVGGHPHGPLTGPAGVCQCLGCLPSGGDLGEVAGKLGDVDLRATAVQPFDRLTDPPVQPHADRNGQPVVEHLPDQGVRKAVPVDGARLLGDEAQRHRLRQRIEHAVHRQLTGGADQRQVELPADHCCSRHHLDSIRR